MFFLFKLIACPYFK